MTLMDYVVSAIALGIQDSCNPYVLSMALCFLAFLAFIGNTPRCINTAGKITIGTAFGATFFLAWSENALWLERPTVSLAIYFFSLGVAVFLLVAGYALFRQWRQGKTSASARPLPLFLVENATSAEKNVHIISFSVMLGLATVLLGSLWPKPESFYIFYYFLYTSGNVLLATLFFALYGLAFTFPLLMVWGVTFYVKRSTKLRNSFLSAISWLRICFSA